jgi:hypothetical protein
VHADSTARDSAVAWGLAMPSYQDVIREATYRIVAQTGDSSAIPQIEALLGTGRYPAHVLAVLAARGSAHAFDALTAHLDDERPAVRRWVVEAFQFTLPRQLGVPRLQAIQSKLKYADTKKDVDRALEQLKKPAAADDE